MKKLCWGVAVMLLTLISGFAARAAEVPDHLYVVGHLKAGVWNKDVAIEGTKDGSLFYFENVDFNHSDGWNGATFGFLTSKTFEGTVNPSDYYYSSQSGTGGDVGVNNNGGPYSMYKSYSNTNNERKSGWSLPGKGTYTLTADFTDADNPKLYIYKYTPSQGGEDWSWVTDWPTFRIRTGDNSYAGDFVRTAGTNEYVCHTSSSAIGNTGQWFKICKDGDWNLNYGTVNSESTPSTLPFQMQTQQGGMNNNFINQDWGKIVITFKYDPRNPYDNPPVVYFTKDEEGGDDPNPGTDPDWDSMSWPEFYIRDNQESYPFKFTRQPGTNWYTVDIEAGANYGNSWGFKICDQTQNWDRNFGPTGDTPSTVPFAVTTQWRGTGNDFEKKDWGAITIKFQYDPRTTYTEGGPGPIVYILPKGYTGDLPQPKIEGLSGTLPVLYINVRNADGSLNNSILDPNFQDKTYFSKKNCYSEYWLDMNGVTWMEGAKSIGSAENPLALDIKGRGNWTLRGFVKKPFKLKLDKKQSLLGLSNSKHFAILAHADDNAGYLRNFVGFELGKRIGLPWTPSQQPVEVVINGDYRGLYFLTESIRVEEDRINIDEVEDGETDACQLTGGYLVEFDNYADGSVLTRTDGNAVNDDNPKHFPLYVTPDTPEVYSEQQRAFVTDQLNLAHDRVGGHGDDMWAILDLDDAVRYYIVEEIISHYEAYHGSTYLFRPRGDKQKWHFSPLWDCGHAFEGGTNNYFYESDKSMGNTWIRSMKQNGKFDSKMKETWKWFMSSKFDGLYDDIDKYCTTIAEAAKADHARWGSAGKPSNTGGWEAWDVQDNTDMNARKNMVKQQLTDKINWLKGKWGDYNGTFAEPERDQTEGVAISNELREALPHTYEWSGTDKKPSAEYSSDNSHFIGHLHDKKAHLASFTIEKPAEDVTVVKAEDWATNWSTEYDNPSVEIDNNGDIYLKANVPGTYNVKISMAHHVTQDGKHYPADSRKMTVTVKPSLREMQVGDSRITYNNENHTITYTGVTAEDIKAVKFILPFEGELYYSRKALQYEGKDLPLFAPRAESEYPYGLTDVTTDGTINLINVAGLTLAHKVNGVVSDPVVITMGDGIMTAIETLTGEPEGEARYFDLNGIEIARPNTPGVYVRVCRGHAVKVLVK